MKALKVQYTVLQRVVISLKYEHYNKLYHKPNIYGFFSQASSDIEHQETNFTAYINRTTGEVDIFDCCSDKIEAELKQEIEKVKSLTDSEFLNYLDSK